jgi:hypothetical protein
MARQKAGAAGDIESSRRWQPANQVHQARNLHVPRGRVERREATLPQVPLVILLGALLVIGSSSSIASERRDPIRHSPSVTHREPGLVTPDRWTRPVYFRLGPTAGQACRLMPPSIGHRRPTWLYGWLYSRSRHRLGSLAHWHLNEPAVGNQRVGFDLLHCPGVMTEVIGRDAPGCRLPLEISVRQVLSADISAPPSTWRTATV